MADIQTDKIGQSVRQTGRQSADEHLTDSLQTDGWPKGQVTNWTAYSRQKDRSASYKQPTMAERQARSVGRQAG